MGGAILNQKALFDAKREVLEGNLREGEGGIRD